VLIFLIVKKNIKGQKEREEKIENQEKLLKHNEHDKYKIQDVKIN